MTAITHRQIGEDLLTIMVTATNCELLQTGCHLLSNHIEGDLHTVALTLVVVQSPTSALPSVTVATRADAGTNSTYKASLTKQEVLFILWQ